MGIFNKKDEQVMNNKKEELQTQDIKQNEIKSIKKDNNYSFINPIVAGVNSDGSMKYLSEVSFREPTAGDLRGLSLVKIFESDVDSWLILLSRITTPMIHKEFLDKMSLSDTPNIIAKVLGLLGNGSMVEDTHEI